jgi:hypothetical protein
VRSTKLSYAPYVRFLFGIKPRGCGG